MDRPSDISAYTEQGIAVDSVKHQNTEVIQTVANRLAIIGDELSLSYQDLSCSSLKKFKSCATLEGCLDILLSVLKAWNWKFRQITEAKPSSEMHGKNESKGRSHWIDFGVSAQRTVQTLLSCCVWMELDWKESLTQK